MITCSSWHQIETEYKQARFALDQLLKEGGSIQEQTEQLILNLDAHYEKLKNRVEGAVQLQYSLASPLPPAVDRKKLKGILAYRAWDMKVKGALAPSVSWADGTWGSEVAFADRPPSMSNTHGLHATRIEYWHSNHYGELITGLVDLYGTVIEHKDGVMRAECARIVSILITITEQSQTVLMLTGVYEAIKYRYPNTPVYIITPYQLQLILWREVLVNYEAV